MVFLQLRIDMVPVAKGRPRFFRRGRHVGTYTPAKTEKFERAVKNAVLMQMQHQGITEPSKKPISVYIEFIMPRPKSHTQKQRDCWAHAARPDLDNLCKAVLDSCNELVYKDDSQIFRTIALKRYVLNGSELPGINVEFSEVEF